MIKYPNLELLEYKCEETANAIHEEVLKDAVYFKFKMDVFIQTWANTATGFDYEGGVSGQAFTDAYTTVCEMSWCDKDGEGNITESPNRIYGVFFNNEIAYMFINPNKKFFKDLREHRMKSQKYALKEYT